jgi:hypothetical protein
MMTGQRARDFKITKLFCDGSFMTENSMDKGSINPNLINLSLSEQYDQDSEKPINHDI